VAPNHPAGDIALDRAAGATPASTRSPCRLPGPRRRARSV